MEYLNGVREKFDLIFLDPPYADDLLEKAIAHIARFDILAPHGIIAAEHPAEKTLPALAPPYRVQRTYRYGKIGLTVYRRSGNEENEE
jgi:16S rRNA G966 N2-methylase RsmD